MSVFSALCGQPASSSLRLGLPQRVGSVNTMRICPVLSTVSRYAVLTAVREHSTCMSPWADTCYRSDSHFLAKDSQFASRSGVQQLDPPSPSVFSIAIHPCIVEPTRVAEELHLGGHRCPHLLTWTMESSPVMPGPVNFSESH